MSYFAAALFRIASDWDGSEVDLGDVEDLDGVVDTLRSAAGDEADVTLLLVEEDDEWFAIVRADDDEARVFLSDPRVIETSAIGALFAEAVEGLEPVAESDDDESPDDDDEEPAVVSADPVGDADLLRDLKLPAARLTDLATEEGHLPADVLSEVCERIGCLDVLERLREG